MATKQDPAEDDSFIVLGTAGASLEINGINHLYGDMSLKNLQLDDALKDLSDDASMAFKAHFKSGDGPSPASLMAASTIVTDDKTTEDLQKRFGEILDENVILKETLKQTNESMKEQFLLIASCQEDMMKTHLVHREKFDETRELIEKLRQENKTLKLDIVRLADGEPPSAKSSETKSGPSSALEFVTSPDDDTINKLTAQLELVEKQRRQVIVDNEKLSWQKESLERIVDASSKERDDLKEKVFKLELQLEMVEKEYTQKINSLNNTIQELNSKIQSTDQSKTHTEDLLRRDAVIQELGSKIHNLQGELKTAQLKILDFGTVKLEYTKHKSGTSDTVKLYKEQIQELNNRLREAQITVFQPARVSFSAESDTMASGEFGSLISNVKLYDKTLKHLAELLNMITHGSSESLSQSHNAAANLLSLRIERGTADAARTALIELHEQLGRLHSSAVANGGQVKNMLTIFEGIFKDYNELLKKSVVKQENPPPPVSADVEALTGALLARDRELQSLKAELATAVANKDDAELLKAQADLYKMDFEAEREAREKIACEKDNIQTDFRTAQRRIQELTMQLEEVRKLNPNLFRSATSKRLPQTPATATAAATPTSASPRRSTTGNMVYTCPKCNRFSSDQYKVMEDHFDFCLDDF